MRALACLLGVLVLLVLPAVALAADPTIAFDNGQPTSPAAGKISATGQITVPTGVTVQSVTMYAVLTAGGQGGDVSCMVDGTGATRNFSGTINNLPAGTYNVFVRLKFGGGTFSILDTAIVQKAVAAPQ